MYVRIPMRDVGGLVEGIFNTGTRSRTSKYLQNHGAAGARGRPAPDHGPVRGPRLCWATSNTPASGSRGPRPLVGEPGKVYPLVRLASRRASTAGVMDEPQVLGSS